MYKRLIPTKDSSLDPFQNIGKITDGIAFRQKTSWLGGCNENGFKTICLLTQKKFSPVEMSLGEYLCAMFFDDECNKIINFHLEKEPNANRCFVFGFSCTVDTDVQFHLLVLDIIEYIGKCLGSKFYVDDATGYLEHRSEELLEKYIKEHR